MVKFFIPSLPYSNTLRTSIKSKWIPWLFLLPVGVYIIFRFFETELTHLIIPLFPVETDKSFAFYHDFLRLCFHEMLWLSFFLLLAWIVARHHQLMRMVTRIELNALDRPAPFVAGIVSAAFLLSVFVAMEVLRGFPNSADEYVYLYQAQTLSEGRLTYPAHPLNDFFHFNHIVQKDGLSTGRFPPGWPLLLAIPFALNVPALWVNPILALVTLFVFYAFVRKYYNTRVAFWSLVILALTGYYIFQAGSYFSHTSCLLFTVCFIYALYAYQEHRSDLYPLLAGLFLGLVLITRYYTAVLIFLPVMISFIYRYRWEAIRPLFVMGLGTLPFFALLFWYNYQITGNPILPVTSWTDSTETLGFVKGHTPGKGIEHFVRRIFMFFYWSSPALLLLYFVFLFHKLRNKAQRYVHPEDYFMIILLVGYFFYHHLGGNQYGPRFVFEAYPFMVVFVVNRALKVEAKWPVALLVAGVVYAVVKLPYIMERENRVVHERLDLYVRAREADIKHAVILISSHAGVIRPMPVSDLTRNRSDYGGDIIYAHDRGERNIELMEYYPDRAFYRYIRNPEIPEGELVRIR